MLFRLALALGRTVGELRAVLSHTEFREWCLYYQIEPWGEDRADLRAGIVASTVANVYARWVGDETSYRPIDFMPYAQPVAIPEPVVDERPLTDDQLAAWADAAVYGIAPN